MAELEKSVTRDLEFLQTKQGQHFFRILEAGKEIYLSDPYDTSEECCEVGIGMLDYFHATRPLLNDRRD